MRFFKARPPAPASGQSLVDAPLPLRAARSGEDIETYKDAAKRAHANGERSKWPRRGEDSRLEPECWPILKPKFRFARGDTVFTIGSCFARNIERQLRSRGFRVPTTEFTVPVEEAPGPNTIINKYTPFSVYFELAWTAAILDRGGFKPADAEDCLIELRDGRVVDAQLVGFVPVTRERAVERRRAVYELYCKAFDADVVVITLGLIEAWWDRERGLFIQQIPTPEMLKSHPDRFGWHRLDFGESLEYVRAAMTLLMGRGKRDKKILLTTSPNPLFRSFGADDVLVANTYAKSVLRAVAGQVAEESASIDYFPSYESVMLTRDNKLWASDDLGHVSDEFVGKVVGRMVKAYLEE
jgi:hypothetical protein